MSSQTCSSYFVTDIDTKKQRGELNSAKFNEPQGITLFDHFMFVADKNNQYVKRIDLQSNTVVRVRLLVAVVPVTLQYLSFSVDSTSAKATTKTVRSHRSMPTSPSSYPTHYNYARVAAARGQSKIKVKLERYLLSQANLCA